MDQETINPKTALRLTRVLNASPAEVYEALSDPKQIKQWHLPGQGFSVTQAIVEDHVGGKYLIEMKSSDGKSYPMRGHLLEVVPNQKLEMTSTWDGPDAIETVVTFELEAVEGGKTLLTLTHKNFVSEEQVRDHSGGWNVILDKLVTFLDKQ
jgi:uncharacterized protein YndB with AHSA1/START domain